MRPIASDQNSLRKPLNELLGTQAQVRLLRVLANEVEGPLTAPNAAEHAGFTIPGAHKALKRLVQSGFVVRVGGGRKHQYELRRSDKLVKAVASLFQSEKERYEDLLGAINDKSDHGAATKDIGEWRDILESYSIRRLSHLLKSTSQRANRLRQSNPLFAILNAEERSRLLKGLGESQ